MNPPIIYDSAKKNEVSFPLRISSVNVTNPRFPVDLVTHTEKILNGKIHFLCSVIELFL